MTPLNVRGEPVRVHALIIFRTLGESLTLNACVHTSATVRLEAREVKQATEARRERGKRPKRIRREPKEEKKE